MKSFDNLELEKGMYQEASKKGKTFTQILEENDPSEQYKGTAHEGLDAFQRQLKRHNIKISGTGSDVVSKFYQTFESSILFPEFIDRTVREGMEEGNILKDIVGTSRKIDAMSYTALYVDDFNEEDIELDDIAEGAEFPETTINLRKQNTQFYKRGRALKISYEALKLASIDVFRLHLRKIGVGIGKQQLRDALYILINGDGNDNAANVLEVGKGVIGGTSGKLTYSELVKFYMEFLQVYDVNTALAPKDVLTDILLMEEFKDPQAGFNYQKTGEMVNPLGSKWLRADMLDNGVIIGLDKRYCLEEVTVANTMVEYDKIINRQLERAVISETKGFNKLYKDSAKILKIK